MEITNALNKRKNLGSCKYDVAKRKTAVDTKETKIPPLSDVQSPTNLNSRENLCTNKDLVNSQVPPLYNIILKVMNTEAKDTTYIIKVLEGQLVLQVQKVIKVIKEELDQVYQLIHCQS